MNRAPWFPPAPRGTPRSWTSHAPVVLILGGAALLAAVAWTNRPSHWRPVHVPIPPDIRKVAAEFRPVAGRLYEIEIELNQPATPDDWQRLSPLTQLTQSTLDLRWSLGAEGRTLVSGDARDAAYVSARTTSWRGRLRDALLFEAFHRDAASRRSFGWRGGGTVSRGLGHFRPAGPSLHRVEVEPGSFGATFAGWDPALNIRRSRQDWMHHQRRMAMAAAAGYLGVIGGTAWGLLRRCARMARARSPRPSQA